MQIKGFYIRLLIALLTFTLGVIAVVLWVVPRFRTVTTDRASVVSETLRDEQISLPEGWRRLEISAGAPLMHPDVQQPERSGRPKSRGGITIGLPPDMEPAELEGDSFVYREAYRNRDISIVVGYGEIVTRRNEGDRPLNPCDTPRSFLGRPTYQESILEVDGGRAKFWTDRSNQPEFTTAGICFPPDDKDVVLIVGAEYKDDRALEIVKQIFNSIRFKDNRKS
jgi:hypothetical protein